jgi:hypothetical protein
VCGRICEKPKRLLVAHGEHVAELITDIANTCDEMDRAFLNVDSEITFSIHKTVKYHQPMVSLNNGGKPLKKTLTLKERKELKTKMNKVFNRNIKDLSAELQGILVDDLVTAFQNRMNVLIRAQAKKSY